MGDTLNPLLLLLATLTLINPRLSSATENTTRPFPPDKPPTGQQLNDIVDALVGAGDFQNWAKVLTLTDPSTFPITATIFIPSDDAFSSSTSPSLHFDPSIFRYHIVPRKLIFSDLQRLKIGSRLPTLLPNRTILLTNNSRSNFSVDDSRITSPDLYINALISVHGIESILNYSVYGGDFLEQQTTGSPPNAPNSNWVSPPHSLPPPPPPQNHMGRRRSDAPCLCTEFPVVLSVLCTVLALKIYRNPSVR